MSVTGSTTSAERLVYMSPGALFRVLLGDFQRMRPVECTSCRVPVPEFVDVDASEQPNWWVRPCIPCVHGCDVAIAAIVLAARLKYRLAGRAR